MTKKQYIKIMAESILKDNMRLEDIPISLRISHSILYQNALDFYRSQNAHRRYRSCLELLLNDIAAVHFSYQKKKLKKLYAQYHFMYNAADIKITSTLKGYLHKDVDTFCKQAEYQHFLYAVKEFAITNDLFNAQEGFMLKAGLYEPAFNPWFVQYACIEKNLCFTHCHELDGLSFYRNHTVLGERAYSDGGSPNTDTECRLIEALYRLIYAKCGIIKEYELSELYEACYRALFKYLDTAFYFINSYRISKKLLSYAINILDFYS